MGKECQLENIKEAEAKGTSSYSACMKSAFNVFLTLRADKKKHTIQLIFADSGLKGGGGNMNKKNCGQRASK